MGSNNKIGEWLREKRIAAGLTQVELALQLDLKNSQSIANIESGRAPLPLKYAQKLIQVLKLDPKEFEELALDSYKTVIRKQLKGGTHHKTRTSPKVDQ